MGGVSFYKSYLVLLKCRTDGYRCLHRPWIATRVSSGTKSLFPSSLYSPSLSHSYARVLSGTSANFSPLPLSFSKSQFEPISSIPISCARVAFIPFPSKEQPPKGLSNFAPPSRDASSLDPLSTTPHPNSLPVANPLQSQPRHQWIFSFEYVQFTQLLANCTQLWGFSQWKWCFFGSWTFCEYTSLYLCCHDVWFGR